MQTHLFTPIAIETAGVWNSQEREFIKKLGKRITTVIREIKETSYIFQQVSVAIQRGNMLPLIGSFTIDMDYILITIIVMIVMIIIILITRDSVLMILQ